MLMIVYAFNFIDRQILVIVQESIKLEMELSDTQLGLLTGFSFAMFYVTLGIPIAQLADRSNRKNILVSCLSIWSGLTFLTGFAVNYIQLLIARIGVGIGESGCAPQSHSIISDCYPPEKRATALSIFSLGIYIGIFIAYLGGGIINQIYGWRTAFFVMGVPGLLLAAILLFTVKEPTRGAFDKSTIPNSQLSFIQIIKFLLSRRSFVYIFLSVGFTAFVLYGIGNWFPSFLSRYHMLSSKEIGIANAVIIGIGGAIGTFTGGYLGDFFGKAAVKWYLLIPMITVGISVPLAMVALFANHLIVVYAFIFLGVTSMTMYLAPSIACAHMLVPANMRAVTSSILFLSLNFIGLGGGPLFAGAVSDLIKSFAGEDSLRFSLSLTVCAGLIAAILYNLAASSLSNDLESKEGRK